MTLENLSPVSALGLDALRDPTLFREFSYVNGEWIAAAGGQSIEVRDPADGTRIGSVPSLSGTESQEAVDAAEAAFDTWADTLPQERSALLRGWYNLMLEHREDLALLMTREQGKPLSECRGEIDYGAEFIEFYAEEAKRPNIEGVTSHLRGAEIEVWREPVGVAALVTPWNFPSAMITRKAAAALAAGCTVIVHPSQETPYSALALAELAERAGFPKGVFNVVTGHAPDIVRPWTEDARVRVLSFTGSTEVGRLLYGQSAGTVKRLVLELGGHAPFIVYADADLDNAVRCALSAKFATSGQDCLGANRFYVARAVYDAFCTKFVAETEKLTVGRGTDDPDIGPLMNEKAVAKQEEQVADALAVGARLLTGGGRHEMGPLFFQPTVLADVPDAARIMREETFGPVAAIQPFDPEEDILTKANDTEYGLIAYLHTADAGRIYRASRRLQFGMVAVNRTKVTGAPIPFGGVKQSGLGREGARQGMEEFTEIKYVCRDYEKRARP
ncbi:NAD-dependent succinate-semialdehyde dehydrogenase [Sneathiella chinensis]|uniref:NAD-dependent succinate-semialdehyde dehydrogenase n=1 Tax=Sneathiella chinensis TaxID=349750 RepID=A0ABQ5TZ39_9PROT|nr:NAD-dependent succinate-semialdehyde dehydrogenase [Sneathiella chinensis]GLQ04823.1 NAD-dependent succinate-semialdehyde dehydrogenase [Sneathiella chinensis]